MQMTRFRKSLSLIVCIVLIAAIALLAIEYNGSKDTLGSSVPDTPIPQDGSHVLGEGATQFTFIVADEEGKETIYQINTDKKTVGDALVALNLIAGDKSSYGLYVKTVNGITVDYDKDGKYWAFYVNGEYASTGVDSTDIDTGAIYSFKVE